MDNSNSCFSGDSRLNRPTPLQGAEGNSYPEEDFFKPS